jgi:plastocyanin
MTRALLPILALLLFAAAPAQAAEQDMTFYSDAIEVTPYTGEQHYMPLQPDGEHAPSEPGWITSIKVDVVKKRSASAKALSIQDVMIHHIVLSSFDAVWTTSPGVGCGNQFYAEGEENQEMPKLGDYGINNATADGDAPRWFLTHMLMNHRGYPFKVYVRTRITYSDTPKTDVTPLWLDTEECDLDPTYTVPGSSGRQATHFDRHEWTVPEDGRIIGGQGHLHGGGKYQSLRNTSCGNRELIRSRAYYGYPDHIFYEVRPILHEPSPIAVSRTVSLDGIPVNEGDVLRLTAAYDNRIPHTRVMSIMMAYLVPGEVDGCEELPDDLVTQDVPRRYRKPYPQFEVPLMAPPEGAFRQFRNAIRVTDYFFSQRRVVVERGTEVTWRFPGDNDHDVAVANGPRGFQSDWLKNGGEFSYTPRKRGVYSLYCSLHPGLMSQELKVVAPRTSVSAP